MLRPKLERENIDVMLEGRHDGIPLIWTCQTCLHTPTGQQSPNETHKRLTAAHYQKSLLPDEQKFIESLPADTRCHFYGG